MVAKWTLWFWLNLVPASKNAVKKILIQLNS